MIPWCSLRLVRLTKARQGILLCLKKNVSYETLEARQAAGKIERIALGRSDFYGVRRLFFHYIDIALSEIQAGKSEEVNNG